MLDKQMNKLSRILADEDLQQYAADGFWDLIQAVVLSDPFAGIETGKNIKDLVFHMPTLLFWDKMKHFLYGTFFDYEDQIKLAKKFDKSNGKYQQFVKRLIHLLNEIDDDNKIDYFSALTRSFLLTELDEQLYYKLCGFIKMCTSDELEFIKKSPYSLRCDNSAMISSLWQYGLIMHDNKNDIIEYIFSDFAKALKANALNTDEKTGRNHKYLSYNRISPVNISAMINDKIYQDMERAYQEGVNSI